MAGGYSPAEITGESILGRMDRAARFAFCARILDAPDLAGKLDPPTPGAAFGQGDPPSLPRARPERGLGLEMGKGAAPLPRPKDLAPREARALALARFAHHELQAVELFAWAILRWPDVPEALATGWVGVLRDEQRHAQLYLARVGALGGRFEDFAPHSDYLWKTVPALDVADDGPAAFLASMGLTLEQANLDFSALYRDAFAEHGDAASAAVCQRVFEDEIGHVRQAAHWLRVLRPEGDDVARYAAVVPFPLGLTRAKGRRFQTDARERAGLEPAFIAAVQNARPGDGGRRG